MRRNHRQTQKIRHCFNAASGFNVKRCGCRPQFIIGDEEAALRQVKTTTRRRFHGRSGSGKARRAARDPQVTGDSGDRRHSVEDIDDRGVGNIAFQQQRSVRRRTLVMHRRQCGVIEIADAFRICDHASGRMIRYLDVSHSEACQEMIDENLPEWVIDVMMELRSWTAEGGASQITTTVQDLLGRPGRTLKDFAAEYASHWKPE